MTHDTHPTPHSHTHTHPKKTSPMEGEVFFTGDIQTYIQTYIHTDGHRDSMAESAQWADSVKTLNSNTDVLSSDSCILVSPPGALTIIVVTRRFLNENTSVKGVFSLLNVLST